MSVCVVCVGYCYVHVILYSVCTYIPKGGQVTILPPSEDACAP